MVEPAGCQERRNRVRGGRILNKFQYGIDRDIAVPLHYQIRRCIEGYIRENHLKPGDSIPTEKELCKLFGLSRPTIRRGIDQLVKEGILVRNRGRGTFVCDPVIERSYSKLLSLTEQFKEMGINLEAELINHEVIEASFELANLLDIEINEKLILVERRRKMNNTPICFVYNYFPYYNFYKILDEDLSANSLYKLIEEKLGIYPSRARERISAAKASELESMHLKIEKGEPVLIVERTNLSSNRYPIFFTRIVFRSDKYCYKLNLMRQGLWENNVNGR